MEIDLALRDFRDRVAENADDFSMDFLCAAWHFLQKIKEGFEEIVNEGHGADLRIDARAGGGEAPMGFNVQTALLAMARLRELDEPQMRRAIQRIRAELEEILRVLEIEAPFNPDAPMHIMHNRLRQAIPGIIAPHHRPEILNMMEMIGRDALAHLLPPIQINPPGPRPPQGANNIQRMVRNNAMLIAERNRQRHEDFVNEALGRNPAEPRNPEEPRNPAEPRDPEEPRDQPEAAAQPAAPDHDFFALRVGGEQIPPHLVAELMEPPVILAERPAEPQREILDLFNRVENRLGLRMAMAEHIEDMNRMMVRLDFAARQEENAEDGDDGEPRPPPARIPIDIARLEEEDDEDEEDADDEGQEREAAIELHRELRLNRQRERERHRAALEEQDPIIRDLENIIRPPAGFRDILERLRRRHEADMVDRREMRRELEERRNQRRDAAGDGRDPAAPAAPARPRGILIDRRPRMRPRNRGMDRFRDEFRQMREYLGLSDDEERRRVAPKRTPESSILYLPSGSTDFLHWRSDKLLRWLRLFINLREHMELMQYKNYTGRQLFRVLNSKNGWHNEKIPFGLYCRMSSNMNRVINHHNGYLYEEE